MRDHGHWKVGPLYLYMLLPKFHISSSQVPTISPLLFTLRPSLIPIYVSHTKSPWLLSFLFPQSSLLYGIFQTFSNSISCSLLILVILSLCPLEHETFFQQNPLSSPSLLWRSFSYSTPNLTLETKLYSKHSLPYSTLKKWPFFFFLS